MPTNAPDLVVVLAKSRAKTHVMDRRYAPLGRAICGAGILLNDRPENQNVKTVTCKKCAETAR